MTASGAVLLHRLWHGAWCWDAVRAALAERGVASVAVELPLTDLAADVQATRDTLEAFGRPAVLVGHSYGGAVSPARARTRWCASSSTSRRTSWRTASRSAAPARSPSYPTPGWARR